jgi:hypothetical protein
MQKALEHGDFEYIAAKRVCVKKKEKAEIDTHEICLPGHSMPIPGTIRLFY